MQRRPGSDTLLLGGPECQKIVEANVLPTPQEQAEDAIRWLGEHSGAPGEGVQLTYSLHGGFLGAQSEAGFDFIMHGLVEQGLIARDHIFPGTTLTFKGWERFEQLRRGLPSGRKAFMAMEYGNDILDRSVKDYFRSAVRRTGFDLRRLDDEPQAGLIDARLRVEIQSSRFLIADLTHRNAGAYWEAGYAEGLGKPVIYTCQEAKFRSGVSHFDTRNNLHVLWNENAPEAAATNLMAAIRATISEAVRD